MRYVIVYFDTNGVGRLIGGDNDFVEKGNAEARIAEIEDSHLKPHNVDYRIISYVLGKKWETLEKNRVMV